MRITLKTRQLQLLFVALTSVIFIISYAIFSFGSNLFQFEIFKLNMSSNEFPLLNIISLFIMMGIMFLCFFERFQLLNYQLVLMISLILTLAALPLSFETFPVITGFSNGIYNLTEPWRQLYVPPAIRATVEGITEGFLGFMDIRSVTMESFWDTEIERYRYITLVLAVCAFLFWWLTQSLKQTELTEKIVQAPESILNLILKYPYIFIICFAAGLNEGLFNYTYFLGKEILPKNYIATYQYVIYVSSIFVPMLIGKMADKYGIFFMVVLTSLLLIGCKFLSSVMALLHVPTPMYYLVIVFLESGSTVSIWMLSASLIGERLHTKGIFRSFALSNVAFGAGNATCGGIYALFSESFGLTKLSTGLLNTCLLAATCYFYHKFEKNKIAL